MNSKRCCLSSLRFTSSGTRDKDQILISNCMEEEATTETLIGLQSLKYIYLHSWIHKNIIHNTQDMEKNLSAGVCRVGASGKNKAR